MARAAQPQLRSCPLPAPRHIPKSTAVQSYLAFPPKPTRKSNRKNYLRPKLPISTAHPSSIPPPNPLQDIPTSQDLFRRVKDAFWLETRKDSAPHDGEIAFDSQTSAISSPSPFGSANSFVRIGFHWFGLILLQTLVAVWFLGSSNVDENSEGGNSAAGGSPTGAVDQTGVGRIGNMGDPDEPEFEKKVSEIRALAKKARALEQKKSGNVGADSSSVVRAGDDRNAGEEGIISIKSDVRNEVDQRLMKLQKSLPTQNEKSSKSSNSNARDWWPFGRKVKPGIQSTKARNYPKPKGFGDTKTGRKKSEDDKGEQEMDSAENFGEEESYWLRDEVLERIVLKVRDNAFAGRDPFVHFGSEEELNFFEALDRKFKREGESAKRWMRKKLDEMDLGNGHIEEGGEESPLEGPAEPYGKIQSIVQGKYSGTTTKSNERSKRTNVRGTGSSSEKFQKYHFPGESSSRNGNQEKSTPARKQVPKTCVGSSTIEQQTRRVEDKSEVDKAKNDQLDVENSWWLKLPYVFAILLYRVGDRESPKGLYSLKTISHSDNESSVACTVTFEDRRDANNFCHILESVFEDLGDFRAEALPLSINDMKQALKSSSLKAIVVKKGQLQLYAGQPLEDVEMALLSMAE